MKVAVIDTGGGYRGVYAAGVLDSCIEMGITFDAGIGISAGAANIISFAAGQKGRNLTFYSVYGQRREYKSIYNIRKKHCIIDLDYIYGTLSREDGENPLDFDAVINNKMELYFLTTDALTGSSVYFTKDDLVRNDYCILKASCAIPVATPAQKIYGGKCYYYDGALASPVPIGKAWELGCDAVILLLSRPISQPKKRGADALLARCIQRRFCASACRLLSRAERYNKGVQEALRLQAQGKLLIVAPSDTYGVNTLSGKPKELNRLYLAGRRDAAAIKTFLHQIQSPL